MGIQGKTVYILGAGFSVPAGAPSQQEIMSGIFQLPNSNLQIRRCRDSLRSFFGALNLSEKHFKDISLEDIYTPLDRCLVDGVSFRGHNELSLLKVKRDLEYLISCVIQNSLNRSHGLDDFYIQKFAKYLVAQASRKAVLARNASNAKKAKEYDPLAVICLNWDLLLDNALFT